MNSLAEEHCRTGAGHLPVDLQPTLTGNRARCFAVSPCFRELLLQCSEAAEHIQAAAGVGDQPSNQQVGANLINTPAAPFVWCHMPVHEQEEQPTCESLVMGNYGSSVAAESHAKASHVTVTVTSTCPVGKKQYMHWLQALQALAGTMHRVPLIQCDCNAASAQLENSFPVSIFECDCNE